MKQMIKLDFMIMGRAVWVELHSYDKDVKYMKEQVEGRIKGLLDNQKCPKCDGENDFEFAHLE